MSIPDHQSLMLPLLKKSSEKKNETFIGSVIDEIATELKLTDEDISRRLPSGKPFFPIGCFDIYATCGIDRKHSVWVL